MKLFFISNSYQLGEQILQSVALNKIYKKLMKLFKEINIENLF